MKMTDYNIENGQLVICELVSGEVIRCGFEVPVLQMLPLSIGDGCLVLLDPDATEKPTFENLLKIQSDGSVQWRTPLPDSNDFFVRMEKCGEHIEANTWNGYRVEIDLNSGRTKNLRFVK